MVNTRAFVDVKGNDTERENRYGSGDGAPVLCCWNRSLGFTDVPITYPGLMS